jgi:hypothetical protein
MFNRSKFKPKMASKYLGSKWMKSDTKSSISMLDLYDQYREWITDNATGCELELAAFAKKISEVYPDAIIQDGTVTGIEPKVRMARPPIPPKPQIERDVERLLSIFGHFYPSIEYRGFTVRQVLSELRPDEPQITEEQLTDYLTNSDLYFQHPSKGYWLREWRG